MLLENELFAAIGSTFAAELRQSEDASDFNTLHLLIAIFHQFTSKINGIEAKPIFKDRLLHKVAEETIHLALLNRYFKAIGLAFKKSSSDKVHAPLVTLGDSEPVGFIATPDEIARLLGVERISYPDYLLALLRLVETIAEYTMETIISVSIGLDSEDSRKLYSVSLVNLQIVTKLQNGFQTLDLKNDNIRRKYDGLKYSLKKINGIVYDLSLRNLIKNEVEVY